MSTTHILEREENNLNRLGISEQGMASRWQRRFARSGQPRGAGRILRQELSPGGTAHLLRLPFSEDQETWPWWKHKDLHDVSLQWPLSAGVCSCVYGLAALIPRQTRDVAGCLPSARLGLVARGREARGSSCGHMTMQPLRMQLLTRVLGFAITLQRPDSSWERSQNLPSDASEPSGKVLGLNLGENLTFSSPFSLKQLLETLQRRHALDFLQVRPFLVWRKALLLLNLSLWEVLVDASQAQSRHMIVFTRKSHFS